GSHVVDELVQAGADVRVIDSLHPDAHVGTPSYLNESAEYRLGDLADTDLAMAVTEGVDAVCHHASRVGLGTDFGDVTGYVDDNDRATAVLLRCLHRHGFGGRLVLASSMVVYGEGSYRCRRHGTIRPAPRRPDDLADGRFEPRCQRCLAPLEPAAVTEDAPLDPHSIYAATKVHQEHLCTVFGREHDVPVTSLRYHNVYGPRMPRDTPYAGVASIFRSRLLAGLAPLVFEDGQQRRDFVHVRDVARANRLALLGTEPFDGSLNIASGEVHTVEEMAAALHGAVGWDAPAPVVTGRWRPGDVRHVTASPVRAAERLGFRAEVAFDAGMGELARAELRQV
ncbi:MAG TPA: NAD-dependent epimerase/dehydratase family protein, partial [Acidimicrobiales bacterium]|nr:NAD-dependent epimerase/dehydratase family protein [Acidimicrobiales bacterium]